MGVSLDELIALVKQRGTADTFPEKEELHGLLEPFRALPDQESLRLGLAATIRKGDRLVARVAAEALGHLGKAAAGPLLVGIALDEGLGTSQRAAAVWAMDHHLPGYRDQLTLHEQTVCFSLPVFEMLEDPEADHGFGLKMLLGSYTSMPPAARDGFLAAIAQTAEERGHPMAGLCTQLLAAEEDPERRTRLIDLVAADATQEAVDLLATFAAGTPDAQDAKAARRHLHLLRAKGLRGVVRRDLRESRALITGVDGDACFSVNLIIPRVPTFDIVNLLFHLQTGLRDGFVMENLPGRNVDELVEKIKQGCGTFSCFVPMPLAARIVDEAMAGTKPAVLQDAELARAAKMAEPALAEARREPYAEPAPPTEVATTVEEAGKLLASPGFETWFFEANETTVQDALASLEKQPIRAKGKAGAKAFANRLAKATERLRSRLRADDEHHRLQRMLRHQARLLEQTGDGERAALCRKLAAEVELPESVFLTNMAARAIFDAGNGRDEHDRPARFAEARGHLRARLAHEQHGHCKRDVAYLDMAAAAHTEMVICNREAPSAQRAPLAIIEAAALAAGAAFVDGLQEENIGKLLAGVEKVLDQHELFPAQERADITQAIVSGMSSFMDSVCRGECPHQCFDDLNGDGRTAFYADGLPWQEPAGGPHRGRNEA